MPSKREPNESACQVTVTMGQPAWRFNGLLHITELILEPLSVYLDLLFRVYSNFVQQSLGHLIVLSLASLPCKDANSPSERTLTFFYLGLETQRPMLQLL